MSTIRPIDLAYGVRFALECGRFMPADRLRLQHLLTRWDAQERTPDPGAAIVRQWNSDREYFLKTFAQMDAQQQREMAVAFHRARGSDLTVEQQLAAWQAATEAQSSAADGGDRGLDHGSSTTM